MLIEALSNTNPWDNWEYTYRTINPSELADYDTEYGQCMDTAATKYNGVIDTEVAAFTTSKNTFNRQRTISASVNNFTAFSAELNAHMAGAISQRYPKYRNLADQLEDLSEVTDALRDSAEEFLDWLADQRTMNAFNAMRGNINAADGFRINAELNCMTSYYLRNPDDGDDEEDEKNEDDDEESRYENGTDESIIDEILDALEEREEYEDDLRDEMEDLEDGLQNFIDELEGEAEV